MPNKRCVQFQPYTSIHTRMGPANTPFMIAVWPIKPSRDDRKRLKCAYTENGGLRSTFPCCYGGTSRAPPLSRWPPPRYTWVVMRSLRTIPRRHLRLNRAERRAKFMRPRGESGKRAKCETDKETHTEKKKENLEQREAREAACDFYILH